MQRCHQLSVRAFSQDGGYLAAQLGHLEPGQGHLDQPRIVTPVGQPRSQGRRGRHLVIPVRAHDRHALPVQPMAQVGKELQAAAIRPVEVLNHEDERRSSGHGVEDRL